ncbi:hypothetical protein ACB092_04G039200 [Castanea dentata]
MARESIVSMTFIATATSFVAFVTLFSLLPEALARRWPPPPPCPVVDHRQHQEMNKHLVFDPNFGKNPVSPVPPTPDLNSTSLRPHNFKLPSKKKNKSASPTPYEEPTPPPPPGQSPSLTWP